MDREAFYDAVRPYVNLTTQNVAGTERVLDYGEARETPLQQFAYILATAWWESAQTMHPVKEAFWLSEKWRANNLRYYPWYGRGLIQTTWQTNYQKMGDEIGVDLIADPDALLEWDAALPALFIGMEKGLYTGKALSDYIKADGDVDYINARRIVNGTDKAETIANLADVFEDGLVEADYSPDAAIPPVSPSPIPEPPDIPLPDDPPKPRPWWVQLFRFFFG